MLNVAWTKINWESLDIISPEAETILDWIQEKVWQLVIIQGISEDWKEGIVLKDVNDDFIWEIYNWVYHFWDEERDHIWIEVIEKHRRKWIAGELTALWQELGHELKEEEFSRQKEKILFYMNLWYIPVSIINDLTWEELELDWEVPFDLIWEWYSCRLVLE